MNTPFEWLCHELEARSSLTRLEARGTVRLALKSAGFSPQQIQARELRVVVRKLLPAELALRRVPEPKRLAGELARDMPFFDYADGATQDDSATSIFARLGRLGR